MMNSNELKNAIRDAADTTLATDAVPNYRAPSRV